MKNPSASKQKAKHEMSASFASQIAAYSATAAAAIAVAPQANAAVQNITSVGGATFFLAGATPQTVNFTAGPLAGKLGGFTSHGAFGPSTIGGTKRSGTNDRGNLKMKGNLAVVASHATWAKLIPLGQAIKGNAFNGSASLLLANVKSGNVVSHSLSGGGIIGGGVHNISNLGKFGVPGAAGYVGFKALHSGHNYYGWLRVVVSKNAFLVPNEVQFATHSGVVGAYEISTDPGISTFKAGDIAAVPEPATLSLAGLGLLALGAAGVREFRRRKSAGPQQAQA